MGFSLGCVEADAGAKAKLSRLTAEPEETKVLGFSVEEKEKEMKM